MSGRSGESVGLECGDAVEADGLWKVADLAETGEGAVLLVDGEDPMFPDCELMV